MPDADGMEDNRRLAIDVEITRSRVMVMSESLYAQAERIHRLESALNSQILSYYDNYDKCRKKIQSMENRINRLEEKLRKYRPSSKESDKC
ncbi:hypothetical protein TrispH2_009415 [Trichoplax sp. H2]|nr:hypothetical protein TrispH2_009415 [Trichoplax sp. H2]|eukprot:RDD38082.1 hypothetical protein TrispH2_009415 [Trichoplax sp. H2]